MIEVTNLSFSYNKYNQIFKECCFRLESDKITLLNGANGSGKTTLCRLLSGLENNYSGRILLNSKNINKTDIAKEISYLKQDAENNIIAATPDLDLEIWQTKFIFKDTENLMIKREEALKYFSIISKKDQPVWQLSGGQVKRVGLASILLHSHKYLILDEQFSGIGKDSIKSLQEIITQRSSKGYGALIISHDNFSMNSFCDDIFHIKNKKIYKI